MHVDRATTTLAAEVDGSGALVITGGAAQIHRAGLLAPLSRRSLHGLSFRAVSDGTLAALLALVIASAAALIAWQFGIASSLDRGTASGAEARARLATAPPAETALYDTRTLPIAPESALELNAERPLDVQEVVAARPFAMPEGGFAAGPGQTALECLAQAVHYEAASESEAGQRAVAQVVLNRVRSPAFPNTVCGVVFQGWTRTTGCQFSFTCDGSMQRVPSTSSMAQARRIAREALGGAVMTGVGNATHYHANYVVPYWASSLDKVQTVGRHIFYLIRGALGRPSAFNARYLPNLEQSPLTALASAGPAGEDGELALPLGTGGVVGASTPTYDLAADLAMGRLVTSDASALISPGSQGGGLAGIEQADRGTALKADDVGRITDARGNGTLAADERKGVLRSDRKDPDGSSGN